jgi:2-dehydro-3-deoxyphosphogluconate aldolase/(4S)-4-hydroxy-2-oxoglutarate aldolase
VNAIDEVWCEVLVMQTEELTKRLRIHRLLAVIVINEADDCLPLAESLVKGGITAVELALRTKAAIGCIKNMKKHYPGMLIGAGTVIFPDQVRQVQDAGADFVLAPGTSARVIEQAQTCSLPIIPGVSTPSDIELALGYGLRVLKFFPAEPLGGVEYLRSLQNPYSYLGLQFIPLGGISLSSISRYLSLPFTLAIGGSWIATAEMIGRREWQAIRSLAETAVNVLKDKSLGAKGDP